MSEVPLFTADTVQSRRVRALSLGFQGSGFRVASRLQASLSSEDGTAKTGTRA